MKSILLAFLRTVVPDLGSSAIPLWVDDGDDDDDDDDDGVDDDEDDNNNDDEDGDDDDHHHGGDGDGDGGDANGDDDDGDDDENLLDFAIMGSTYYQVLYPDVECKVALLNIGSEEMKGNNLIQQTHDLLKNEKRINYQGFVEANEITDMELRKLQMPPWLRKSLSS